jgi:hypothetical protein
LLSDQQVVLLQQEVKKLNDIFAEDTAKPTVADEIAGLFQQAPSERKEATGFKEPFNLRSLMPTKSDIPLVVAGAGAASGGIIAGIIQGAIPQLGSSNPAWVSLGAGWLIYKLTGSHQMVSAFGGGMVIGAVASLIQPYVAGFTSGGGVM